MRTKIIILAAVSAVMFLGCSKTEKNSEETYKEENISDKTDLNNLWFDFKSDMPEDRNVEEDFKNSEFMTEFDKFLHTRDSVDYSETEMENLIGQGDLDFFEASEGGWNVRIIGYNADLQNKAVTDSRVRNKYVFLQCWNEANFFCEDIFYYDCYYPMAAYTEQNENGVIITVVSEYAMVHPNPMNLSTWNVNEKGIKQYEAFSEYKQDGWNFTQHENMLDIEKLYDEGSTFGEINGVSFFIENGEIIFLSGDEKITFVFDGGKYIIKK